MALSDTDVRKAAQELRQMAGNEWYRLRRLARYGRGKLKLPWLPDNVEAEYLDIARKSSSNWLGLVVAAAEQGLTVDGYGDKAGTNSPVWDEVWQANGLDARQHALNTAVLNLGYSFWIVFPSDDGGVWMRPESATELFALYEDPRNDEWAVQALRRVKYAPGKERLEVYDEEFRYSMDFGESGTPRVKRAEHPFGITPVVRVQAGYDLLGDPVGDVEPHTALADRIVDATFTMQMVAKYGAFPQRWIAGMSAAASTDPDDPDAEEDSAAPPVEPAPRIKAYVDHILMAADVDTKFGQFAAADLRQYAEALETHVRHLAAVSQTPPHYLLGGLTNLSADAIAAAESSRSRKRDSRREVMGEGHEQALRLAAGQLDSDSASEDRSSQVTWQEDETRSLAQVADACTKLASIGFPPEAWVPMVPGLSKTDVDEVLTLIEKDKKEKAKLAEQIGQAGNENDPEGGKPPPGPPTPSRPPVPPTSAA